MADLKIPSLNKKNDKYLFKNKFSSRKTNKRKLIIESFYMLIISFLIAYTNYLIPNKSLLFKNFIGTSEKSFLLLIDFFGYILQLLLVIAILISSMFSLILFLGSFYRFIKVLRRNSKYF
tara:strand:- start:1004 stop:1363 length:360 start_codon:yes stop_codon:yes gene_type:complete